MKRILYGLPILWALPLRALGESRGLPLPEGPFTWETLATNAGAAAAVLLMVQYVKAPLDRLWKLPTRLVVYIAALALLTLARAASGTLVWQDVPLLLVNACLTALTAFGAYEVTFAKREQ